MTRAPRLTRRSLATLGGLLGLLTLSACGPRTAESSTSTASTKPVCDTLHPYGLPQAVKTVVRNCELGYEGFYWKEGLVPLLAIQVLTPQTIIGTGTKEYKLYPDTTVPESSDVKEELYKNSEYVPAQLVSMRDYGGNTRAMGSTLFITNTLPMTPLFAREVWGKLGDEMRTCLQTINTSYVFSGALPGAQKISNKINIPMALFRVVITPEDYRAFLIPNDNSSVGKPLRSFEVTLTRLKQLGVTIAPLWKGGNRDRRGTLCANI